MTTPIDTPLPTPTPQAIELVETYFARVHGSLLVSAVGECEETVDDLRSHVYEQLARTAGTVTDADAVLAQLGAPETLAAQCAEVFTAQVPEMSGDGELRSPLTGKLLGVPYELRPPTAERVARAWWDPTNPRTFVPRVFGIGWDVNLGAIAVRFGLINPDDEDVPFASVPVPWLAVSAVLPLLVAVVFGVLVLLYQGTLPAQVAVHWGITGVPDRFDSKESALVIPMVMTMLGLAAVADGWIRRRPPLLRVASGALGMLLCTCSAAAYGQSVATAYGAGETGILLPGLVAGLVLEFLTLVTLSRIGRSAEMRRDLENTSKKGSA